MGNVTIRNTTADGQLQDGTYFENAATNETLEEVGGFFKTFSKDESDRHKDTTRAAAARHRAVLDNADENTDKTTKSNFGFMSNMGKMIGEIGNIGIRAYKMEVDVQKDIKSAVNAVSALGKGLAGALGSLTGGALGLAAKGLGNKWM